MIGEKPPSITASRDAAGTILIDGGARQVEHGISEAVAAAAEPEGVCARCAGIGARIHAERKVR